MQAVDQLRQETIGRGIVLLLICLVELAVALFLFIPQNLEKARLAQSVQRLQRNLPSLENLPQTIRELEQSLDDNRSRLHAGNIIELGNAEEVIMMAVSQALDDSDVVLLGLAPERPSGIASSESGPKSLKLQCRGSYPALSVLLSKLEKKGLLVACRRFHMQADTTGAIKLEAILQLWSEEALQETLALMKKTLDKKPGNPGGKTR